MLLDVRKSLMGMENQLRWTSRLGPLSTTVSSPAKLQAAQTLCPVTRRSQTRTPEPTIIPTGRQPLLLSWQVIPCRFLPEIKMLLSSETGRGEDDLKRRHRSSQSDDMSKAVKKSSSSGGGGSGGIALGSSAILPPSPLPARYQTPKILNN